MTKRPKRKRKEKAGPALTGAAILAFDDVRLARVDTPEWQGHVFVRSMTAGERDAFDLFCLESRGNRKIRAYIVSLCAVDADGVRLFSEDDVDALNVKAALPMTRIFMKAREINKLFLADIEDAEKNS